MPRLCLLLVLAGTVPAEDAVLHEERSWMGVVELVSVSREPADGRGHETQRETIRFRLVTEPPKVTIGWARVPMTMREREGTWSLELDRVEGKEEKAVAQKGEGRGRLWPEVQGYVEPGTGRYRLVVRCTPATLTAKTTLSGLWEGRFTTWRTVTQRRPFTASLDLEGEASEEGRVLRGEKSYLDRAEEYPRDVTLTWRVERVDPVLRGRVADHLGRPVGDVTLHASTTNPARRRRGLPPLFREGASGADGSFAIEAFWAPWTVRAAGFVRDGTVYEGAELAGGIDLRPDRVASIDLELKAYRLSALPRPELLVRHFQGDVAKYFEYMRARAPEGRLAAALLSPE